MSGYALSPKAVRTLKRIVRGNSNATGATYSPASISVDDFPPPFTVRWSASENNGNGKWSIWLPDRAKLVMYSGAFVSTISGVTAATALPTGWYTIDDAQANSTTAYLVITVTDSTGVATAEISTSVGQSVTGTTVYNILVASMSTDANTGAKMVKPFVDSVVTLGVGGGGDVTPDDVSTEFITTPSGQTPGADEGKLQIKGYKTATPVSSTTIAADLQATGANAGHVIFRESDGTLKYKSIGTMQGGQSIDLSDFSSGVYFVTGIEWDTTNYQIKATRVQLRFANNKLSVTQAGDQTITTTPWTSAGTSIPT